MWSGDIKEDYLSFKFIYILLFISADINIKPLKTFDLLYIIKLVYTYLQENNLIKNEISFLESLNVNINFGLVKKKSIPQKARPVVYKETQVYIKIISN